MSSWNLPDYGATGSDQGGMSAERMPSVPGSEVHQTRSRNSSFCSEVLVSNWKGRLDRENLWRVGVDREIGTSAELVDILCQSYLEVRVIGRLVLAMSCLKL